IAGEREKQILLLVEDEVLSDERVARVRIWSTAGILIFSTHPRDREGTTASGNEQLGASMTGQVVSDVAEPRSPSDGLAGSGDAMLETFVPLRLTDRAGVAGVVEIDQHHPAITRTARWLWRSLEAVTAALLLGALALADRRVAELEAHVRELEQQRNEALLGSEQGRHLVAGIQAELAAASRRAEDAEQRVRELENEVPPPSDLPEAIAEVHVDEVVLEDTPVVPLPTEDASAREFPLEPAPPSVPEEEGSR
ncbi:MAG TPA: hypothetical protein VF984_03895, partial [Actinomycetota bacterium]